jgi:signal peptidase II
LKVLIVTFFVVLADQITKIYVKGISIPKLGIMIPGMPYQSSINVIGDFFKITFIENPGMAFGLQIGGKLFLSLFTILATMLLFFFLYKNRNEVFLLRLALAFILGGAIGNLIDRVFYGKIYDYAPYFYGRVVDFLHLDFPNFTILGKTIYSWPIFNIADISVSAGFLMILLGYKKIFHKEEVHDISKSESLLVIPETNLINESDNQLPDYTIENNTGNTAEKTFNTDQKINTDSENSDPEIKSSDQL